MSSGNAHMTAAPTRRRKSFDGPTSEEVLLQDLISLIESSDLPPWRKPWTGQNGAHRNLETGRKYAGINPLLLECGLLLRGQTLPLWIGAAQAKAHGWWPKKGSKGVRILRPQMHQRTVTGEDGKPVLDATGSPTIAAWVAYKATAVFHVMDLAGKDEAAQQTLDGKIREAIGQIEQPEPQARLEGAEAVLEAWPVETSFGGTEACYIPSRDVIRMPDPEAFTSREAFVSTWAHEQAHSTGHKDRLARDMTGSRASATYAREELIAELASVLICYRLQIGFELEGHASYIQHWAQLLKEGGTKALLSVMSDARRAADLIAPEAGSEEA